MEIIGRQIEFGIAPEAVRGTHEAAADMWLRKVTASIVERASHAIDDTTRGRLEEGEGRRRVQLFVEGDVSGILHSNALGYFLANLYGQVESTEVVVDAVHSHLFTLAQNIQHPALTLFAKDGGVQQYAFANGMLNTLEINATLEDYVRYTASFIAGQGEVDDSTPAYPCEETDWVARDITLKVAATEAGLAGATPIKAKSFDLTFDQGLIRDHVVGSYYADDVYNSKMMIELAFSRNFLDSTFKDLYLGNDARYVQLTLEGEADLGSGNKPTFRLLLNKAQVTDWNRSGGADELVTEEVTLRGFYNCDDTQQSEAFLQNTTETYPNVPVAP